MARIEDTVGNVTYTFPNCDCGLTGGCEKCQPLYIPKYEYGVVYDKEKPKKIPNIRAIRDKSHAELGDAWRNLANQ